MQSQNAFASFGWRHFRMAVRDYRSQDHQTRLGSLGPVLGELLELAEQLAAAALSGLKPMAMWRCNKADGAIEDL